MSNPKTKAFFWRFILSMLLSLMLLPSCKNRVTEAKTFPMENIVKDSTLIEWLDQQKLPQWTALNRSDLNIVPLDYKSAKIWFRWVTPLPKIIKYQGKLKIPATGIKLQLRPEATDIEISAKNELAELIAGNSVAAKNNDSFEILIGICDEQGKINNITVPGADKLSGLKNNDQAYVISPLAKNGLAVVGLTGKGVYFGVKTLQQLIKPETKQNEIGVPIVFIMDWPDLSERGQWGAWDHDPDLMMEYINFMAERKMNLMETGMRGMKSFSFDENGRGKINLDFDSRRKARLRGIKTVFMTEHLDKLGGKSDIYKRYPKAEGKGAKAHLTTPAGWYLVTPCASSLEFVKVLSEWLESCASQGVFDANLWLTEINRRCECDQCKNHSQYVLEAKAFAKAWEIAHVKYPELRIRILLTQGSYEVNDQILSAITQPEIGITYYSGNSPGTYSLVQEPIIYPLMEDYAREGHWLGVYPVLSASWKNILPWSGAQYIKYRMTEFVNKGISSMAGYVAEDNNNRFYDFNLTAAAEWSWNAYGRDEREFAASWGTQRGISNPEIFADWAVLMGTVGWNVYGSRVPHGAFYGPAAAMITKREQPVFGKGMFRYFQSIDDLERNIYTCQQALELAGSLEEKTVTAETLTLQGYLKMIKAIYNIADILAGDKDLNDNQIKSLQTLFNELKEAKIQTTDALTEWYKTIDSDYEIYKGNDAIVPTNQVLSEIASSLKPWGIEE